MIDAAVPTAVPNLSIVPSTMDLLGVEMEISGAQDRVFRLRSALSRVASRFTYVLVDCPPSLNLLTLNAMAAADSTRNISRSRFPTNRATTGRDLSASR